MPSQLNKLGGTGGSGQRPGKAAARELAKAYRALR